MSEEDREAMYRRKQALARERTAAASATFLAS
jgi:hypothetical protein